MGVELFTNAFSVKKPVIVSEGCGTSIVKNAKFDGLFQIPIIKAPKQIAIPKALCPFSKRNSVLEDHFALCFYESYSENAEIFINPDVYIRQFK